LVKTNTLTKEEDEIARKRTLKRLNQIMPRRKLVSGQENIGRGPKYQELLKEEREKIKIEKNMKKG